MSSNISRQGRQQGREATIPIGASQGHDDPQEPSRHLPCRRPCFLGQDREASWSSLRGFEPLPTKDLCTLEQFDPKSLIFNVHAEWALTTLKAKLASSLGPKEKSLRDLWAAVVKPQESAEHYKAKLAGMQTPNWKSYAEEQEALAMEAAGCKASGTLTCLRCGWTTTDEKLLKKHKPKCPAKKSRAKAKAKAKSKPKATPKSRPNSRPPLSNVAQQNQARNKRKRAGSEPLPPPPEAPPEARPIQFFQRQRAPHRGMHALNNALQGAIFQPRDMQSAAQSYLQEMQGLDEARDEHIREGGWYSVQILYTALFNKGKHLDFHDRVLACEQAIFSCAASPERLLLAEVNFPNPRSLRVGAKPSLGLRGAGVDGECRPPGNYKALLL